MGVSRLREGPGHPQIGVHPATRGIILSTGALAVQEESVGDSQNGGGHLTQT